MLSPRKILTSYWTSFELSVEKLSVWTNRFVNLIIRPFVTDSDVSYAAWSILTYNLAALHPETYVLWSVSTDPPSEAKIRKEIQALGCHKAPSSADFYKTLLKDERVRLAWKLQVLFFKIWYSEKVVHSWQYSIAARMSKKSWHSALANHKGVSLIPISSKLLAVVVLRRFVVGKSN